MPTMCALFGKQTFSEEYLKDFQKFRIVQVRAREAQSSAQRVRKFRDKQRRRRTTQLYHLKEAWEQKKRMYIADIEARYANALENIGQGHKAAIVVQAIKMKKAEALARHAAEGRLLAAARHQKALQEEHMKKMLSDSSSRIALRRKKTKELAASLERSSVKFVACKKSLKRKMKLRIEGSQPGWRQYVLSLQPSDYRHTFLHAKVHPLENSSIVNENSTNAWEAAQSRNQDFECLRMNREELKRVYGKRIMIRWRAAVSKVLMDKKMKKLEQELEVEQQAERKRKCDLLQLQSDRHWQSSLTVHARDHKALPLYKGVVCVTTTSGQMSQDASTIFNLAKGQDPSTQFCFEQPSFLQDNQPISKSPGCGSFSPSHKELRTSCDSRDGAVVQGHPHEDSKLATQRQENFVFLATKPHRTASNVDIPRNGEISSHVRLNSDPLNGLNVSAMTTKLSKEDDGKCSISVKKPYFVETGSSSQPMQKKLVVHYSPNSKATNKKVRITESSSKDIKWISKGMRPSLQQPFLGIPQKPPSELIHLVPSPVKESVRKHSSEATTSSSRYQGLKKRVEPADLSDGYQNIKIHISNNGFWDCGNVNTSTSCYLPEPAEKKRVRNARWKDGFQPSLDVNKISQKAGKKRDHYNLICNVETDRTKFLDAKHPDGIFSKQKSIRFVSSRYKETKKPKTGKYAEVLRQGKGFLVDDPKYKPACCKGENPNLMEQQAPKQVKHKSTNGKSAVVGSNYLNSVDLHPSKSEESPRCHGKAKPGAGCHFEGKGSSSDELEKKTLCKSKDNSTLSSPCLDRSKSMCPESVSNLTLEDPIKRIPSSSDKITGAPKSASLVASIEELKLSRNETVANLEKSMPCSPVTLPSLSHALNNSLLSLEFGVPKASNDYDYPFLAETTINLDAFKMPENVNDNGCTLLPQTNLFLDTVEIPQSNQIVQQLSNPHILNCNSLMPEQNRAESSTKSSSVTVEDEGKLILDHLVEDKGKLILGDSEARPDSSYFTDNDLADSSVNIATESESQQRSPYTRETIVTDLRESSQKGSFSRLSLPNIPNFNRTNVCLEERCRDASSSLKGCKDVADNIQEPSSKHVTRLDSPNQSGSIIKSKSYIHTLSSGPQNSQLLCLPTIVDEEIPGKFEAVTARAAAEKLLQFLDEQTNGTFCSSKQCEDCGNDGINGCSGGSQHVQDHCRQSTNFKDPCFDLNIINTLATVINLEVPPICGPDILNKSASSTSESSSSTSHKNTLQPILTSNLSGSSDLYSLQEKEVKLVSSADHVAAICSTEATKLIQDIPGNGRSSLLNFWDSTLLLLTKQVEDLDERLRRVTCDLPSFGLDPSVEEKHGLSLPKEEFWHTLHSNFLSDHHDERKCNPSDACESDEACESVGCRSEERLIICNHEKLKEKAFKVDHSCFQESDKEENESSILKSEAEGICSRDSSEDSSEDNDCSDCDSQVSSTSRSFRSCSQRGNNASLDDKLYPQISSSLNLVKDEVTQIVVSEASSHRNYSESRQPTYSSSSSELNDENRCTHIMNSKTDADSQFTSTISEKQHTLEDEKCPGESSSYVRQNEASCTFFSSSQEQLSKLELGDRAGLDILQMEKGVISEVGHKLNSAYLSDESSNDREGTACLLKCLEEKYLELSSKGQAGCALILLPEKPNNSIQDRSSLNLNLNNIEGRGNKDSTTSTSLHNTGSPCSSANLEDGWSVSDAESLSLLSGSVDFSSWSVSELPDIFTPREILQNYSSHIMRQMRPLTSKNLQRSSVHRKGIALRAIKCRQQQARVEIKPKRRSNLQQISQFRLKEVQSSYKKTAQSRKNKYQ